METFPILSLLVLISVLPLFVEVSSDGGFQMSSKFTCTKDAGRMTAQLTLKKNIPEEVNYIRIRNKDMVELAAYSPPNKVLYNSSDTITGMMEWKNGWLVILESNFTGVIHVEVDSDHKPWNSTIQVNCATDQPTCSSALKLSSHLWGFVVFVILFCLAWLN